MKKCFIYLTLLLLALFTVQQAAAQYPVATAEQAITGLLNRIGGSGAAGKFEIVIDASLAEDGKDVFIITSQNGKPCIKGNTQLSVATGINWYLNHYAHINLTWNNLTTDLSAVDLPVPDTEDKHVCNTTYRYDFNTCTFSYSMAFWTWDRWQKEIDWMALHGINAPLNLVGLDVVTRNFLKELGVSDADIASYIAGPGFIAWFAMNNLEGWGGTINSSSTGVDMSGNPDWWYTRQEQLCKNMLQRMRELGMQPVIPGFSGQVPNCIVNYASTINTNVGTFSSSDVINNGGWAGGYTRPDILAPSSSSYATLAPIYYKHLEAIMGVSEFYSMDPFHEGTLPSGVTNTNCYPNIMAHLDTYHNAVEDETKTTYNVTTEDSQAKWIIQYWQGVPQTGAFTAMKNAGYTNRFIGLDLFADNIYADNAAMWRTDYYDTCPYLYCMLHNFGGRSGLHGRLETTMNGYFEALAKNNNCQGIGATPEGTETNPILYDMLFELPWMDVNDRPTVDEWLEDYAYSRYGIENETALAALQNLKKSVWDCKVNQQGTSEAVILARPAWTVGSVSSWSTSAIYWDTQDVRLAADQLISIAELVEDNNSASGTANYNYDAIDVVRQAMVDFAAELLPLIKAAFEAGNTAEYTRLYQLYLQLMLDLDTMLSYDENFKLERWTSLARNIADEVDGTTDNDRNWLEWNARTQVTVWSKGNTDLHDYSNRCWAGLIKDFHYWRWKYFFENNGGAPNGGWFSGFEYPWTVDFNDVYSYAGDYSKVVIPTDMTATEKAVETFGKYFGRVKGAEKNYIFPMGVTTNATKSDVIPEVYRGQTVTLPLTIGKSVTVSSVQIDLNGDGAMGDGETLEVTNDMDVAIPADATIGKTKATVTFSDGTVITFNLAIIEDITENRTVTAATANTNMGTVAIEGDDDADGSITNMEAVKITATANTGYNFKNWTDGEGNVVSNDNPYIYYGKDAASFTANFVEDLWGVPTSTTNGLSDAITNNQYVNNIDFAYYNREAESIYSVATNGNPTSLFTTIPQIINVPQGASFTISWTDNATQDLTKCFLSAYMDFNANGDFSEAGELVKVVGTKGADNAAVRSGSFQVLLPYDAPLGITHLRMRFDSAWGSEYNSSTGAFNPKGTLDRMCYEIIINVTEGSDKAAHVTVESNNTEWGTAEVWTDETPGWTAGTEWDVSANIPVHVKATKAAEDVVFLGWYDHYGRLLTTDLEYSMLAKEDAHYTAKFLRTIEIDGWVFEYRTEGRDMILTKIVSCGDGDIAIPERTTLAGAIYNIVGFDNGLFNNCKELLSITLPASMEFLSVFEGDVEPNPFEGCANLDAIAIDGTCANYNVDANGDLYNAAGQLVCSPAGKAKSVEYRALGELIEDFSALIDRVATINPVGTVSSALPLTITTGSDYYVSTNADQNTGGGATDGGGIEALVDNTNDTYFHSRWSGTAVNAPHHIQIDLGVGNELQNFQFSYVAHQSPDAATIVVSGSNDGTNFDEIGTITKDLTAVSSTYTSKVFTSSADYRYLLFEVTESHGRNYGNKFGNYYCFGMKEFDLYKVSSSATVHAAYTAAGITADMVASDYDALVTAIKVYNNATTAADLQAQYDIIEPLYTALKALADAVYSGVFQINYQGDASTPVFIQYNDTQKDNAGNTGYKLIGTGTTYTTDAAADKLFTITPSGSGYTLSAQGKYLKALNTTAWNHALFSDNEADAGVYHFEETSTAGIYKLKVESGNLPYLNNYDNLVFGSNGTADATFGFARVEEYTLTVPASGYTTLCLPFNVVLPAGVTAYDIVAGGVYKFVGSNVYELNTVATEGETLAKGTPVIIKATAGDHVFEITMDNDGAKGSTEGTVLRSGLVKTTIGTAENNYTFADGAFTLVTASTAVPANQCWMVLGEQFTTSIINKEDIDLPFELTTDEYFPELYNIYHKRTGDVLGYDYANDKVDVVEKSDNNIYQAWYFKASEEGVRIYPYNGNGNLLGANDTSNGNEKLLVAESATYQDWVILYATEANSEKYYYIKTNGTFVNDFANATDNIGFWDSASTSTDGSLFRFVDAEFDNDNHRYYQLSDLVNTMDVTTQAKSGDAPGCREGGDEHYAAYTAAKALITAGSTADYDDCYAAYTNIRATRAALGEIKQPVAGTVYRIRNYITDAYESKKNHYIANTNSNLTFPTAADENTTLWLCVAGETDGTYKFISAMGSAEFGWQAAAEHAQEYTVKAGVEQGAVALVKDAATNLALTNEDHNSGLNFNQSVNGAMQKQNWSTDWYLEPVDGATVYYSRSIPKNYSYGTLYLPFSVTIPDGVNVYTAEENVISENGKYYVDLVAVSAIIPARTAVILHREDKTSLQEFRFDLTSDDAAAVTDNVLDGCVITSAVGGNSDMRYYLLFRGAKGEAFYWMKEEYNENGDFIGEGAGYVKCEGNKAYLELAASNFTSGQSSTIGFRFPGTTGVEEVKTENGEVKAIYDLQGRKINEITQPGFYIVDGEKVWIK